MQLLLKYLTAIPTQGVTIIEISEYFREYFSQYS